MGGVLLAARAKDEGAARRQDRRIQGGAESSGAAHCVQRQAAGKAAPRKVGGHHRGKGEDPGRQKAATQGQAKVGKGQGRRRSRRPGQGGRRGGGLQQR